MVELYYHLPEKFRQFAVKQQIQCPAGLNPVFTAGGQITPDATEHPGTIDGSKTAGYLLLDLRHANVTFAQII